MTDKDLLKLAKAATQGPWKTESLGSNHFVHFGTDLSWGSGTISVSLPMQADAEYIAAANPAVIIDLLGRLKMAEKALGEFHQLCEIHPYLFGTASDIECPECKRTD